MWLIGTKGIFSIVAHRDDKDQLLVRSRTEKDIDYFKEVMDELGLEPLSSKVYGEKFDYPWRFFCLKEDVDAVIAKMVDNIDYTNFKSAAGGERRSVLFKVYNALMGLDDRERVRRTGSLYHFGTVETIPASELDAIEEDVSLSEEEEQLHEQIEGLEMVLENIAYVAEGKGPARTRRGKIRLIQALVNEGLFNEKVEDPKLARQLEQVRNEEG